MFNILSCVIVFEILHFSSAIISCNRSYLDNATVKYGKDKSIFGDVQTTNGVDGLNEAFVVFISNNDLPELCDDSFDTFPNLQILDLSGNNIEKIEPGAFKNLGNETIVSLELNQLKEIQKGIFNGLKILALNLASNQISSIDSEAFDDMPNLEVINVNINKLKTWNSDWFRGTPNLSKVYFGYNQIEKIPANAFKNIHGEQLGHNGTVDYTTLLLAGNQISDVNDAAFVGHKRFGKLIFSSNKIQSISKNLFGGFEKIDVIDLKLNEIKCLDDEVISSMNCVKTVKMQYNPIEEECALRMASASKRENINLVLLDQDL